MDYKKRKTKRIKVNQSGDRKQTAVSSQDKPERINMKRSPHASRRVRTDEQIGQNTESVRHVHIIEGGLKKNTKRRRQSLIIATTAVVIIVLIIIINAALPTGLIEWSQNKFSGIGSGGGLPVSVSGDRIDDFRSRGSELFIMSESYMYAYNKSGKRITTVQHGYNSPRLELSSTRSLIYDRGSYSLRVDTLYTNFIDTQLDNKIITADICDKGYVAVATDSNDYSAEVTVYDSEFKSLFRWSTASGQVSTLKLSPNGEYLAASVVSGKNGDYSSEINIFEIKSGSRIFTKEYGGSMFVRSSADNKYVTFIGVDNSVTLPYNGTSERNNDFYRLEYFDSSRYENMVAAYHPDGDDRRYTVSVIGNDGVIKASLNLQGDVGRVCSDGNNIYTYNSGVINKYDFDGNKLNSYETGYEYVFITAFKKGVGVTHDMKLDYYS